MKRIFTKFFLTAFLFFVANQLYAQLNYLPGGFTTSAGTYTDLGTNGTVITVTDMDDGYSSPLPIGFTFNFNGSPNDSFIFSTNGFIKLGRDTPSRQFLFTTHAQPPANGPFTSTTSPTPTGKDSSMLFAFGQDLYPGGNAAQYRYYTSGTPGSQVCTIQWKNVKDKLQATVAGEWDTINFQIKLYESTNVIEYVYGKWTASTPVNFARFSAVGIVGKSMVTATENLHLVKGSTVVWSGAVANTGFYVNNAVNYRTPVSTPAGPAPDLGRVYTFTPLTMNDASVRAVYAQGRVALPYYQPDSIRANISNTGINTLTGLVVTVSITGTNFYIATTTIPSLAPNANVNVSFPPFFPTNAGANLISVYVPSDDNNANNTKTYSMSISNNRMGYTDTLVPASGGNGTTAPNFWGSKFFVAGTGMVTRVYAPLAANSEALGDTVCGMVMDSLGKILARSPNYIVQASDLGTTLNFLMSMPAVVSNQSVIVGIAGCQSVTGLTYFLGTSQTEVPFRPNTSFYFMSQSTTGGMAAAAVGTTYAAPVAWATTRLMMECRVEPLPPNDIGISASGPIAAVKVPVNVNIPLRAVVKNFGTLPQLSGLQVRYQVNGGPVKGPVSTSSGIAPNDTTSVLFTGVNALNLNTAGTNTVKIYTSLAGDGLLGNDTLIVVYNAVPASTLPYRIPNNILSSWTVTGNTPTVLWKETTAVQSNGVSNSNVLYADNIITTNGRVAYVISPPITLVGTTNPVLHFNVAHGPNTTSGLDDTLNVMVSTDGGLSFTSLYTKSSQLTTPKLGTDTPVATTYLPAYATDWRHESVSLVDYIGNPFVLIAFRDRCASGNGIYIGNIAVTNPSSSSTQSVFGPGTYSSGNMSIIFGSIGSSSGEINFSRYTSAPYSSASPVFATNTTATSNNASIFTPNNVSQSVWYSVTYSGIGTGNYPQSISYSINFDLGGVFGIPSKDSLYLLRRSDYNGSWVPVSSYVSGNNLYTATLSGFSDFTIGSVSSVNPLPVEWINFTAKNIDDFHNQLDWTTASEVNSSHFVIERSFDRENFMELGQLKAAGNSNKKQVYTFKDVFAPDQPFNEITYYRIKQADNDGAFSYSKVVAVVPDVLSKDAGITITNPFEKSPIIWIDQLNEASDILINVIDINGKKILSKTIHSPAGNSAIQLDEMETLVQGVYFIEIIQNAAHKEVRKILKLN